MPIPRALTGGLEPAHAFPKNKITVFTPSQQEQVLIPAGTATTENTSTAPPGIATSASRAPVQVGKTVPAWATCKDEECLINSNLRGEVWHLLCLQDPTFGGSGTQGSVTQTHRMRKLLLNRQKFEFPLLSHPFLPPSSRQGTEAKCIFHTTNQSPPALPAFWNQYLTLE